MLLAVGTGRTWLAILFVASLPTTIAQILVALDRNSDPWWLGMDPKARTGKLAAAGVHIAGSLFFVVAAVVS